MEIFLGFYSSLILQADNFASSHSSSRIVSCSFFLVPKPKKIQYSNRRKHIQFSHVNLSNLFVFALQKTEA